MPFPAARIRIAVFCLAIVPHVIGEGDFLSLLMKACHKALTTSKARFPFQTNGNMRLARRNPTGEAGLARLAWRGQIAMNYRVPIVTCLDR
ncbi:MAG: hypothetical protein COA65_07435 [Rhodospirillaceae bacterium]|nr:MAG: hypothetical protein COA65_07435 [Rhodospirillaceae bacterium]